MSVFKLGQFSKDTSTNCTTNRYLHAGKCTMCPEQYYCDGVIKTKCASDQYCPVGTGPPAAAGDFGAPVGPKQCTGLQTAIYSAEDGVVGCKVCNGNPTLAGGCALCDMGTKWATSACVDCGPNTYQDETGQTLCKDCPSNSSPNSDRKGCACKPGYGVTGLGVTLAELSCTKCGKDKFLRQLPLITDDESDFKFGPVCTQCPTGMTQVFGANSGGIDSCKCPANTYRVLTGDYTTASCTDCPANKVALAGSTVVTACKYEECPVNHYLSIHGDTKVGTCTKCPDHSSTIPITDGQTGLSVESACVCKANYFMSAAGVCTACPTSSIASAGSTSIAQCLCPVNTWMDKSNGTATCTSCVNSTTTSTGSTSIDHCVCDANFWKVASTGSCTACEHNKAAPVGSTVETACKYKECLVNHYLDKAGVDVGGTCIACLSNSSSAVGDTECKCDAGFEPVAPWSQDCKACVDGYFSTGGDEKCAKLSVCPTNYIIKTEHTGDNTKDTTCTCPAGKRIWDDSTALLPRAYSCVDCPAGKYSDSENSSACTPAAVGYATSAGATAPVSCHSDSSGSDQYSNATQTACMDYLEVDRYYSSVWASDAAGTGHARSMIGSAQAWSSTSNVVTSPPTDHVTLDLKYNRKVIGVITQGRAEMIQYVTKFKVEYAVDNSGGIDEATWKRIYILDGHIQERVFEGNVAGKSKDHVWNYFSDDRGGTISLGNYINPQSSHSNDGSAHRDGIKARWLRIIPTAATNHISMRVGAILSGNAHGVYTKFQG